MSANPTNPPPSQPPKLLDRLRGKTRLLHYSKSTEDAYADWATKFILFHGKRHPQEMGTAEIAAYLTHLAVERKLSASTPVNSSIRRVASWAVCGGRARNSSSIVAACGVNGLGWPFQPNDRMPAKPFAA